MCYLPQRAEHRCCHLHRTGQGKDPSHCFCCWYYCANTQHEVCLCIEDDEAQAGYQANLTHRPALLPDSVPETLTVDQSVLMKSEVFFHFKKNLRLHSFIKASINYIFAKLV